VRSTRTHPIPNPSTREGGTNPGSYKRSQVECHFQEAWYELPPKPMARAQASRTNRTPRTKVHAAHLQRHALNPRHASGRWLNPGPKRSGPADGALPVEVHLRSRGRGKAQSGAEVVRPGSYPVSRVVPKKPSRMPLPGGLVRSPTEARDARAKAPRTARTAYPQSREPNPGHTRERGLKSRSDAVRTGVGHFLSLDAPLPTTDT
jgi:hypothetical protein